MHGEVVQDHDVPWPQRRHQHLLHVGTEARFIDRSIEDGERRDGVEPQGRDDRAGFPVTARRVVVRPRAPRTPAIATQRGGIEDFTEWIARPRKALDAKRPAQTQRQSAGAQAREGALVWQFVFSPDQMKQLAQPGTWCALVCGAPKLGTTEMDVCLLDPERIGQLLDISKTSQQSLTVKRLPGKSLRVSSVRVGDEIVISRNRLDEWAVPGS